MASLILRQAIYAAWPAVTPFLRYVQTENRDMPRNPPLVLPDTWGTVGFDGADRRQVTMGDTPWVVETGIATMVICTKSGHGDVPGISVADQVMRAWDGWEDRGRDCWFNNVNAPTKLELEADGEWFIYGVRCAYEVQERITLP